jgi:hypothetical protein
VHHQRQVARLEDSWYVPAMRRHMDGFFASGLDHIDGWKANETKVGIA